MSAANFEGLMLRLSTRLEEAPAPLRARPEWRSLDAFHRELLDRDQELPSGSEALEDLTRDAEAKLDLLELARAEVDERSREEERSRSERLATDEAILAGLRGEMPYYVGAICLSFVLPPLLLFPMGSFLVVGAIPAFLGFARMYRQQQPAGGRIWLVLQDEVNHVLGRVKLLHAAAIGALVLTGVWVIVANLARSVAEQ